MQTLQGIAVSPGIAIGEALVISQDGCRAPRRLITREAIPGELARFHDALRGVTSEIQANRTRIDDELGQQYGAIFGAHLQLLADPRLRSEVESYIQERHYSPEYAVSTTLRRYAKLLQEMDSPYLAERANDLLDLERALLRTLTGGRSESNWEVDVPVVVLANTLTPSETAALDRQFVQGFVTEWGGAGGHTAIVAKALEIPAVVGVGKFLEHVAEGDLVIVDGDEGRVILAPDPPTLEAFRRESLLRQARTAKISELRELPAQTTDGERIAIHTNIEFPSEAAGALERGAEGVGLYRTEFLYLNADHPPTEEEHYEAYVGVARVMGRRPVTIRTFDLGADKLGANAPVEENPFLGLRSIRLSLRQAPTFRIQLRAILRASVEGNVRVMFPLVSTLDELRHAKQILADAMEDLDERGVSYNKRIPIGMMVETPAAVVMIDRFLREVDFISLGTNDLIQYALAVDRTNPEVADLYSASEPAVLHLIDRSVQSARQWGKEVSLCGQMSGSSHYGMLLVGLGLRSLSVPPSAVPEIKAVCRSVSARHCREVADRALRMESAREVDAYLREELRKAAPDLAPQ